MSPDSHLRDSFAVTYFKMKRCNISESNQNLHTHHVYIHIIDVLFLAIASSLSVASACSLAKKKVAEKKVAITVFSFPPDKGNVGTAAYLNVFGSIWRVLQDLKAQGYTVDDVPEQEEDLIKTVSYTAALQLPT